MTPDELKGWLPLLKEYGVQFFKTEHFEICFNPTNSTSPISQKFDESNLKTEKVDDVVVPHSLEEEPSMTYDKILNWSVESNDDIPVPLTGTGE